jgi:hypothetical protein
MTMIAPIDKTDDEIIQNFERRNRSKVRLALKRGTKAFKVLNNFIIRLINRCNHCHTRLNIVF